MFSIKSCRNGFAMLSSLKQGAFSFFSWMERKQACVDALFTNLTSWKSFLKKKSSYFATQRQQKVRVCFRRVLWQKCVSPESQAELPFTKSPLRRVVRCVVSCSILTHLSFSQWSTSVRPAAACCQSHLSKSICLWKEVILRCFFTLKCFILKCFLWTFKTFCLVLNCLCFVNS